MVSSTVRLSGGRGGKHPDRSEERASACAVHPGVYALAALPEATRVERRCLGSVVCDEERAGEEGEDAVAGGTKIQLRMDKGRGTSPVAYFGGCKALLAR